MLPQLVFSFYLEVPAIVQILGINNTRFCPKNIGYLIHSFLDEGTPGFLFLLESAD